MKTAIIAQLSSDLFDTLGKTGQAKEEFRRTEIVGQPKNRLTFSWFSPA